MTHSDIKWNKLDDFIEQSKEKVNAFKRLEEIENEKKELHKNEQILVDEENKIREKYKQEYTKRLNDRFKIFVYYEDSLYNQKSREVIQGEDGYGNGYYGGGFYITIKNAESQV